MSHHAPLARLPAPAPCGVTLVPPTWPAGCPATACGVTAVPSLSPAGCPTASCGVTCARSPGRPIARPRRDEPIARLRRVPRSAAVVGTQSESGKRRSPRPARRFRVAPEADPVFSSERFLRPAEHAAQGFSGITSRFFCHPQDIRRLSPVHALSPLLRAQLDPQFPGITASESGPAGAAVVFLPTMLATTSDCRACQEAR
jgi:hypothetical protein